MAKQREDEGGTATLEARVQDLEARLAVKGEREQSSAAFEAWKAWAGLSAREKTQRIADERWGKEEGQVWQVDLHDPEDKIDTSDHPIVQVRAHSAGEARARYQELCGIRQTEHQIRALAV